MLIPDRKPDYARTTPVADEIRLANVIRVEKRAGKGWRASIGPPGQVITAFGGSPATAVIWLMSRCDIDRWPFDETWRDNLE